jgi:hypothetical protein
MNKDEKMKDNINKVEVIGIKLDLDTLMNEHGTLVDNINRLTSEIECIRSGSLVVIPEQKMLMCKQYEIMLFYLELLAKRIEVFNAAEVSKEFQIPEPDFKEDWINVENVAMPPPGVKNTAFKILLDKFWFGEKEEE